MKKKTPVSRARSAGRLLSGSGIVVLALILAWLWNGSDGGSDTDDGEKGSPTNNPIMTSTQTDPLAGFQPQPSDVSTPNNSLRDGLTIAERAALSNDVLTLLIDDYDVKLAIPSDGTDKYRTVDLKRASELASLAEGDSNGIRVRILRYGTARPAAEESLRKALQEVGITEAAIYMPADYIPEATDQP